MWTTWQAGNGLDGASPKWRMLCEGSGSQWDHPLRGGGSIFDRKAPMGYGKSTCRMVG